MNDRSIHVAYFSFSGRTRAAAAKLLSRLPQASSEAIRPRDRPYWPLSTGRGPRGIMGYLRAALALHRREAWPIETVELRDRVRLLVIATPVWWGLLPPPVRSYMRLMAGRFDALAVLTTQRSGSSGQLIADITRESGQAPRAIVAIASNEQGREAEDDKIAGFADLIGP